MPGNHSNKKMLEQGGFKLKVVLVLAFLALVGWAGAVFSAPYLRKARFEKLMEDYMRDYVRIGLDGIIENLIKEAKNLGLPELKPKDFQFEGGPGEDSTLRCFYTEVIKLPGNYQIVIQMKAEKTIKIPTEPL